MSLSHLCPVERRGREIIGSISVTLHSRKGEVVHERAKSAGEKESLHGCPSKGVKILPTRSQCITARRMCKYKVNFSISSSIKHWGACSDSSGKFAFETCTSVSRENVTI